MSYKFQAGDAFLSGSALRRLASGGSFTVQDEGGAPAMTIDESSLLFTAKGRIICDDTTEASSTTDGSVQTDGGLSVAKSAVIGDDLDLLSDGAILNIGSTSKFTLTDQSANNCVMAASGARLAFGNAGEYISGDGTDLDIISSGDLDITATLVDVTGAGTFSGILKTDDVTDATTKTDGSLQTDGGLSVAKAIYNGTAATLAADSGVVTIGSTTAATFSAAGLLNVNNATDATSKTDGSLQTDGGLSVAKAIYNGTAATLAADSGVVTIGSTTAATFSAAGLLNVNNATDATSKTDGSLQTDGGLSVAKAIYNGTAATLAADSGVVTMGSTTAATISAAGLLNINNATDATSGTDGSLQTDGGLSVVKKAYIAGGTTLAGTVTLSGVAAAVFNPAADSVYIKDADDSSLMKSDTWADIAALIAGAGITATNGVLSTDAASTPAAITNGATLSEGINYATGSNSCAVNMPASPDVGDRVTVKAAGLGSGKTIAINMTTGIHRVDGLTALSLGSSYGSVTMVYVTTNDWRVI